MPRGDGTGPMGMGPMTGRAAGYCAGFAAAGFANPGAGFGRGGFGRGFGFGGGERGRRNWFRATGVPGWMRAGWPAGAPVAAPSKEDQVRVLSRQAELLEESLAGIKQRLADVAQAIEELASQKTASQPASEVGTAEQLQANA